MQILLALLLQNSSAQLRTINTKTLTMKQFSLSFLFYVATVSVCILVSCHNGSQNNNQDAVDSAKQANDSNATAMGVSETDSKFAVNAADGGMTEVEAAKTAQQKAMNARVKSFADMMVMDLFKSQR